MQFIHSFVRFAEWTLFSEYCPRLLRTHDLVGKQTNKHMMTMQCDDGYLPTRAAMGSVGLRTQHLSIAHLTPESYGPSPFFQSLPLIAIQSLPHPHSILILPHYTCFLLVHTLVLSQDPCMCSSSARKPSPTLYMLPPSRCQFQFHFFRVPLDHPLTLLNFLHSNILIIPS